MAYLEVGALAPDFTLPNQDGKEFTLSSLRGKKVVLYFYPKDSTPGCTIEANDFRVRTEAFDQKNAIVIGVSRDSAKSHTKFIEKHCLPFMLLSDTEHEVMDKYGVWQEKNNYGIKSMGIVRTTYVIDEEGHVAKVYKVSKVAGHVEKVLSEI